MKRGINMVNVPLDRLTDRQVHLHLISLYTTQTKTLTRLEKFMSDLTSSVSSLQDAVDSVAVRWNAQMVPLTAALAAAQAAADASNTELAAALNDAQAAADAIGSQVTELNALGANPETPVGEPTDADPAPADPAPADPAPADPAPADPAPASGEAPQ